MTELTDEMREQWRRDWAAYTSTPEYLAEEESDRLAREKLAALLAEDRWIPVEEQPPPERWYVLTGKEDWPAASMGYFKGGIWWHAICDVNVTPSHWRPMPASPKTECEVVSDGQV